MTGLDASVRAGPLAVEWRLEPCQLLRATAFPWALLGGFAAAAATGAAGRLLAAEREAAAAREALLDREWQGALERAQARYPHRHPAFKRLFGLRRAVQAGRPPPGPAAEEWARVAGPGALRRYLTALDAAEQARRDARAQWEDGLARGRRHLHELLACPRVREAIFLSSPGFDAHGLRSMLRAGPDAPRNARLRAHETTAHRYVQRLCSRCETTSFFGPVLYVTLDSEQAEAVRAGPPGDEHVVVDASAWVVEALGERLAAGADPTALRPRRNPLFGLTGDETLARCLDGRRVRPGREVLALWREADGTSTAAEAARRAGLEPERLPKVLAAAGPLLLRAFEVPATALHQLRDLAAEDGAAGPARRLLEIAERYAAGAWPRRRELLADAERLCAGLGIVPRRGAGRHYADRTVLREDRSSPLNLRVRLGRPLVEGVQRALADVLPLCLLGALLRREDARDALRGALAGRSRPLGALAGSDLPDARVRARQLDRVLADLPALRAGWAGDEVVVDPGELTAALAPLWDLAPLDEPLACLPGFDLLAAGTAPDRARWVLGELHDDCSSIYGGFTAALHPDAAGLRAGFEGRLARLVDPEGMATIVSRRRTKHITPEPPGLSIELSGRSEKPRAQTAPIAEVEVEASGRRLRHGRRLVQLYPGDLASTLHRALSLPALTPVDIDLGEHTPRVVIGSTVYQRARWRVRLEPLDDAFDWWTSVAGLRARLDLPRHVFVRHPQEPKPLHLDLTDPLGVEALRRLPDADVLVTEMLPGPGELWWPPGGDPECAELRVGCLLRAARAAPEVGT